MNQQLRDISTVISGLLVTLDDIPLNTRHEPSLETAYQYLEGCRDLLNGIIDKENAIVQADIANGRGRGE